MSGVRFLVAVARRDSAEAIVQQLASEFGADAVVRATSLAEAESRRGTIEWLIVSERWSDNEGTFASLPEGYEFPGSALAHRWTECRDGKAVGRAVLLTESQWWNSDLAFTDRLLGLPTVYWEDCYKPQLIEMIRAAEANVMLLPPTTIAFAVEVKEGTVAIRYLRVGLGPLTVGLERRLEHRDSPKEFTIEGWSNQPYLAVLQSAKRDDRRCAVLRLSRAVHKVLDECGFLAKIRAIAQEVIYKLKIPSRKHRIGPYPVHLHLECDPGALSFPLDLALAEDAKGSDGFSFKLPIVWVIRQPDDEPATDVCQLNETAYAADSFKVAHAMTHAVSFDSFEFSAIPTATDHSTTILKHTGVDDAPAILTSADSLVRLFNEVVHGTSLHITAHGVHNRAADCSGVLIASTPSSAMVVRVADIAHHAPRRVYFAYFNCCQLGYRDDHAAADCYHSSFIGALIRRGACREAICNRWTVSQELALQIAEKFYLLRPRTIYGRSVALLVARRMVLDDSVDNENDVSWLAPVHVWEC
jgi:hypothetical protein